VPAAAQVRDHDRLRSRTAGVSQPGAPAGRDGAGSALASRYYLHPAGVGVCLSGGDSGRLLAPGDWLGAGPHFRSQPDPGRPLHGAGATQARARPDHSDRGVQYASRDYTDLLQANRIVISMSRRGNPYDNATCESFLKTLKYEEVYRTEYRDLAEARASIGVFLEQVYNQQRLHSALGYLPPAEFEAQLTMQENVAVGLRFWVMFTTQRVPPLQLGWLALLHAENVQPLAGVAFMVTRVPLA
jgi:Integrase core domain